MPAAAVAVAILLTACSPEGASPEGATPTAACTLGSDAAAWEAAPAPKPKQPDGRVLVEALLPPAPGTTAWEALGATADKLDRERAVAVWRWDGTGEWSRAPVRPVTGDGPSDTLLSASRHGDLAVAVGNALTSGEGVPRPSGWYSHAGGPWNESPEYRETFGGPRAGGVRAAAAGPLGAVIVGTRVADDARQLAAVWRSSDGVDWLDPEPQPALLSEPNELVKPYAAVVSGRGVVMVGVTFDPTNLERGWEAVAWVAPDGRHFQRASGDGFTGPGDQWLDHVAATGDGFVVLGRDGQDPAVWRSPDGRRWERLPDPGLPAGARLDDLTVTEGRLLAAGAIGGVPCLWRSADGKRWAAWPLPAAAQSPQVDGVRVATQGDRVLVAVQSGGRVAMWTAPLGKD